MKTHRSRWYKTIGLCLPVLLLTGSAPAFAGGRSSGCFDPDPPFDDDGNPTSDASTEGQFPSGDKFEVGWGLDADREWMEWLRKDLGLPPTGLGGSSGSQGAGGNTGSQGAGGNTGSQGAGGSVGAAGSPGSAGSPGGGGSPGSGSGGNPGGCGGASYEGCSTGTPTCSAIRQYLIAHPAEGATVIQDRLNVTLPKTPLLEVTAFRVDRPLILPARAKAALGLSGNWAIATGRHFVVRGLLSLPLVRVN